MIGNRPQALMVMSESSFSSQFDAQRLSRLGRLVDLGDPPWTGDLDEDAVGKRLAGVEILITSWGAPQLTASRLDRMPRLSAVFHAAGSIRSIVTDAFWERRIMIANVAESNAVPVAEYTFAAIVMAGKKAPFLAAEARRDHALDPDINTRSDMTNFERTIGVIGFSRVGRRVVRFLQNLDSVTCLVADPYASSTDITESGGTLVSMDDLLRRADTVTVHAPELPETHHMIGARQLALMADSATLINTARGSLVDTRALEEECATGRINAILDVTDPEPLPGSSILYDLPNVMLTPHVAGSLASEKLRLTDSMLEDLARYLDGASPVRSVTREMLATSA